MRDLILVCLVLASGCSKSRTTEQPVPVQLKRKFFDDEAEPAKRRVLPNPQPK